METIFINSLPFSNTTKLTIMKRFFLMTENHTGHPITLGAFNTKAAAEAAKADFPRISIFWIQ